MRICRFHFDRREQHTEEPGEIRPLEALKAEPEKAMTSPEAGAPTVGLGRRLQQGWLELAAHFGEIQTLLIVCVVYLLVLGPISLVATLSGRDLLVKRGFDGPASAWLESDSVSSPDLARAKRLF